MNNSISKNIVSGMFWRFGEKFSAQLVSLIVSIVLARILMPEDYGIVAIVNVFVSIMEIFVTSGLGTALIQKKEATDEDFSTLFWSNIVLSLIIYVLIFAISPRIAIFYDMPLLTAVLRVFAIRLPINAVNSIQNAYISRHMEFKKFFYATISGTIVSAIIGIYLAYIGCGVWALIVQMLTNTIIDTIVLSFIINWRPEFYFSWKKAKPLISYGWKILITDLIGTIFNQLNSFIIGILYSSEDLAFYSQGKKYPELINNNIEATLSAVLFPAMSLCIDKEEMVQIRRKSLKMMYYLIFPIMFGMYAIADKMIIVLLTDKWIFAVPYLRITCITAIINVFGTTFIQEIKAIGRSDITLKMELIKKPIYLIILCISLCYGVKAIAFTAIINSIIAFIINVYPVNKYIGYDYKMHLLDAVPSFAMSIFMCCIVYFIGNYVPNDVLGLITQIVVGGVLYLVSSIITKNDSFIFLKNMIINKLTQIK